MPTEPQEVVFRITSDTGGAADIPDDQIEAILAELERRGALAKQKTDQAAQSSGALAGARRGGGAAVGAAAGVLGLGRLGATALALTQGKEFMGDLLQLVSKRMGEFIEGELKSGVLSFVPDWMIGDKDAIDKRFEDFAKDIRGFVDERIEHGQAFARGLSGASESSLAAAALGASGSLNAELLATWAQVDYLNSSFESRMGSRQRRQASAARFEALHDMAFGDVQERMAEGLAGMLGLKGGTGR